MVKIHECSGALVSLGRGDTSPGLVLAAGHCPNYPNFYANGVAEGGTDYSSLAPANGFPPGSTLTHPVNLPLARLFYATLTNVDVSLYELASSVGALREQKLRLLELGDRLPKSGEILQITSGFWRETETCEVESILEDNAAEKRAIGEETETPLFRNSILFKSPCFARGGWSGGPVFDAATGLIYGIVSRVYSLSPTVSFSRFAGFISQKWNPFHPDADTDVRVVASNVIDLKDCLTADGKLGTSLANCQLPKLKGASSPLPSLKPSSSWPVKR